MKDKFNEKRKEKKQINSYTIKKIYKKLVKQIKRMSQKRIKKLNEVTPD